MIQCVIFDCDGTLVDSEHLCNLGLAIELKAYGIDADAHLLMQQFRGWKLAKILQELELKYGVVLASNFVPAYRERVSQLFKTQLRPISGIEQALTAIGLPKCVASSGPMAKIKEALAVTKLSLYFGDNLFSAHHIQVWKPDPGLFLHAAAKMDVAPTGCVVVEDSEVGIEAALAANMRAIYYNPNNELLADERVLNLSDMSQLPNLVYSA